MSNPSRARREALYRRWDSKTPEEKSAHARMMNSRKPKKAGKREFKLPGEDEEVDLPAGAFSATDDDGEWETLGDEEE